VKILVFYPVLGEKHMLSNWAWCYLQLVLWCPSSVWGSSLLFLLYWEIFVFVLSRIFFHLNWFILFFIGVGWGCIAAFTKFLTIYHIYQTWIHPLPGSPLFLLPQYWNSFNRYLFNIYIHMYTVFAPYSPSCSLTSPPSPSHCYQHPSTTTTTPVQDLFHCHPIW
jgi:hypothetical protein